MGGAGKALGKRLIILTIQYTFGGPYTKYSCSMYEECIKQFHQGPLTVINIFGDFRKHNNKTWKNLEKFGPVYSSFNA